MLIESFFDLDTATFSYIVVDPATQKCAVIDPVLNYDPYSGRTSTTSLDQLKTYITSHQLEVTWILETHCHADHLSGAYELKKQLGGKIAIGEGIRDVLAFWVPLFDIERDTPRDGSQFDTLFKDGETFQLGQLQVTVLATPGHTPACVSYLIGDAIFVGDTLLMPDVGTARTDFPGGCSQVLFESIEKLLAFPAETRLFTCHDYPPEGRERSGRSTVAQQRASNIMVRQGISKREFIKAREAKDRGKAVPRLLLPSIQVNLRAGALGQVADNRVTYLKIPLNQLPA